MSDFTNRLFLLCVFLLSVATASQAIELYWLPPLSNPSACNLGLTISEDNCDNNLFEILVDQVPDTVMGKNVFLREVRLIISHEWADDLDVTLISPSGMTVELTSDNGDENDNYGNPGNCNEYTTFLSANIPGTCDAPSIEDATAPFLGEYLPEQNLALFNDGSDPRGTWILQICDDGKKHVGTLEFVELVFEAAVCLQPTDVTVLQVDSVSVLLDWVPGSNCENTIIEYGPSGFIPGNGNNSNGLIQLDSCPPVLLDGILPSTTYDVYIREECASSYSANSCAASFTTTCSPPPLTLIEDFNSQNVCLNECGEPCQINGVWTNSIIDDFDWIVFTGPVVTGETGPTDDVPGGGNYIYIETSGSICQNGRNAALTSNCILVQAGPDSCDMSFDYIQYGIDANRVSLEVTTDGGITWVEIWRSEQGDLGPAWRKKFIDLDPYHGQSAQFRFVGLGGNETRGDIALDNIAFYGSVDLGPPPFVYYLDEDLDGYGNKEIYYTSCLPDPLPGFVADSTDCFDTEPDINPGVVETPCDFFDINCNGDADEFILPPPLTFDTMVCSGAEGPVVAVSSGGDIYWYDAPEDGNLLHIGPFYQPADFPVNFSSQTIELTFYAEEFRFGDCMSTARSAASIFILPQPELTDVNIPPICNGSSFDLSTIDYVDINGANGLITYHNDFPPSPGNEIDPVVFPVLNDTFYIVSTSIGGCLDAAVITFDFRPGPIAHIDGPSSLCFRGAHTSIEGTDLSTNSVQPVFFEWNTGDTNTAIIDIFPNPLNGITDTYILTLTSANGCTDRDTLNVLTGTNVDTVVVDVEPVLTCGGSEGQISLTPVDGQPPYTYQWNNGIIPDQPGGIVLDNLEQGTYSFTITDISPEQCEFVTQVTVDGPGAIITQTNIKQVSCNGGSDGCIEISAVGNNLNYLWNTGATSSSICDIPEGFYSVTITDGTCEKELFFTITEPEPIVVSPSVIDVICFDGADGSISLSVFGGSPPYQFEWNTGAVTQNINQLSTGAYTVTISDTRGCQEIINSITIKQPEVISYDTLALVPPACFDGANGSISIQPTGGTKFYDVDWSNGGMGSTITNLASGTYTVTIEDVNLCTAVYDIFLSQPDRLEFEVDSILLPTCKGLEDGAIFTSLTGGTGPYSFDWSNFSTVKDPPGIPAGDYLVTVTDANGCLFISDTITVEGKENFLVDIEVIHPPCVGVDNGCITVNSIQGGIEPYEIKWSTDETGPSICGLPPDRYVVTITDSVGCQLDTAFLLPSVQPISVDVTTLDPTCNGINTGKIFLNISGASAPFHISGSGINANGDVIENLYAGNYAFTVTDADSCQYFTDIITLTEPDSISVDLLSVEPVICHGGANGAISISVEGGVGGYQIEWSNGSTQSTSLGSLESGVYSVTVEDANNCVKEVHDIEIPEPDPLELLVDQEEPGCEGGSSDSLCIIMSGGHIPYQYNWSHGETVPCLFDAPVGDYTVTVTDQMGCSVEESSIKVSDDVDILTLEVLPSRDTICAGTQEGELAVKVDGAVLPYQFIWSNGVKGLASTNTLTLDSLSQGNFKVTITDANGCTAVADNLQVTMGDALNPVATGNQIKHVSCKYGSDGAIDLSVSGGFPAYSYLWIDQNGDTLFTDQQDIDGLLAGSYLVEVTDTVGCSASRLITVSEPEDSLQIDLLDIRDERCFGLNDGQIKLVMTGGTLGYTYSWDNGANAATLSGLAQGLYQVTVTDANDCDFVSMPIEIKGPDDSLQIDAYDILDATCFGEADGEVQIDVLGGTPPYYFDWGVTTDEDLTQAVADVYDLTIWDANLCRFDTVFEIGQPDELLLETAMVPATFGMNNGIAYVIPEGGVGPYLFKWDDPGGSTNDTLFNVPMGYYTVTVTDANFCEVTQGVEVTEIVSVSEQNITLTYVLYPNPTSGEATLDMAFSERTDAEVLVFDAVGQVVFRDEVINFSSGKTGIDLSGRPEGMYIVLCRVAGEVVFSARLLRL